MADVLTKEQRKRNMQSIRSKDTKIEMILRKALWSSGIRYRKNYSKIPGKEYVVILDFIGNYTNNFMIPIALSGDRTYNKDTIRRYVREGSRVIPGNSTIHFDEISRKRILRLHLI